MCSIVWYITFENYLFNIDGLLLLNLFLLPTVITITLYLYSPTKFLTEQITSQNDFLLQILFFSHLFLSSYFSSQYKYYLLRNSFHYLTSFVFTTEMFPRNPELEYELTLDFLVGCRYGTQLYTPFHPQNGAWYMRGGHFLFEICTAHKWKSMHPPHEGHQIRQKLQI